MSDSVSVLATRTKQHQSSCYPLSPLPGPPFLLTMIAPPMSGKTTVLANFIANKKWGYKWDKIVIISPTAAHDPTLENVIENTQVVSDLSLMSETIENCIREQDMFIEEEDDVPNLLLIVDDAMTDMKRGKMLARLGANYRHYNISIIVSCQQFRSVPPEVRTCSNYWILFNTWNSKERFKMEEEFSGQFKNFLSSFISATEEKYHFLYIDIRGSKLYKDFNTLI